MLVITILTELSSRLDWKPTMSIELKQQLKDVIQGVFRQALQAAQREAVPGALNPFRSALIPDEFWRLPRFERSFVTRMGTNGFEVLARLIATRAGHHAEQNHLTVGEITTTQADYIHDLLARLRSAGSGASPNWEEESRNVNQLRNLGPKIEISVVSDLFLSRRDGTKEFYSIKTVKPNLDQTENAKRDCLRLIGMSATNRPFFALPYNPYGQARDAYSWGFAQRLFNMHSDSVVLIGEEFWDHLGGMGTYELLLQAFVEVGRENSDVMEAFFAPGI